MEEDIDSKIKKFETILKTRCVSKSLLYSDEVNKGIAQSLKSEDIINSISRQIKALNNNVAHSKIDNSMIKTYKECRLTSINNIQLSLEPQEKCLVAGNSANHCVCGPQLLITTKDAEAITDLGTGVTQEFETYFGLSQSKMDSKVDGKNIGPSEDVCKINTPLKFELIQETIPNNCKLLHAENKEKQNNHTIDICNMQSFDSDCKALSLSPILLSNNTKCEHNTSFLLESFEKFEAIAVPIVHENYSDVEAMKKKINLKVSHDNKLQVTLEKKQHDDRGYDSKSIHLSPILKLKTNQEEIRWHTNCNVTSNDEFIKEEIIFSSNEDIDIDHNQVEELPLTCALQTSFYEQDHVLDKTIYVGFQTASNKSIQVLTDSFTRAKSILNDCHDAMEPNSSLSLSELVKVYDSALNETKDTQRPRKWETTSTAACKTGKNAFNNVIHSAEKGNKVCQIRPHDKNVISETDTIVSCTQEQIKIDDYIMQEFEENLCIDDNKLHTNICMPNQIMLFNRDVQPKSNNNTNVYSNHCREQFITSDMKKNINDETFCTNGYQIDKTNSNDNGVNQLFIGFKTASNKCINISKEALVKSKKILDEVHFQSQLTGDERDIKNLETTDKGPNVKQLFKVENNNVDIQCGFKTASNIPIRVSNEAYMKSKNVLQEFHCDNDIVCIDDGNETGRKRKISKCVKDDAYSFGGTECKSNIIEETLVQHDADYYDDENIMNYLGDYKECVGNEKKVKSINSVNDILLFPENSRLKSLTNSKSNGKRSLDIDSDQKAENNYHNKESIHTNGGYTKESNKRAKISLSKPNNILENDIHDQDYLFQESFKIPENKFNCLTFSKNVFQGFKTANNNPVKVSDKALMKSKEIFKDIGNYNNCDLDQFNRLTKQFCGSNIPKNVGDGFKTASNKPIQISDEALEQSKKIFQAIDDFKNSDTDQFKHQKLDCSSLASPNNAFEGIKITSNNPVKMLDDALEQSKKKILGFHDCNNFDLDQFKHKEMEISRLPGRDNTFQGFKTARNSPVKISDEALEKSKKIFQDIGGNNNCESAEYQVIKNTARNEITFNNTNSNNKINKLVNFSDKASKNKSKIILEDINSILKAKVNHKINNDMQKALMESRINEPKCERYNILEARKNIVVGDKTPIENFDVRNIINTEVINNFNDTMLTEDFLNSSPPNKRSGSPILSCPKAKKKKLSFSDQPDFEASDEVPENLNRFIFSCNYKKYKKYKLLDLYEMDEVPTIQPGKEVNYNIDTISRLEFVGARNEISKSNWTTVNIKKYFLELVNKNIVPSGWAENHIRLITLKLLSYEKRFPKCMKNVCSVRNIMEQLKYRYDRELYNVERPAIRKILEKDEVPTRRMVLQVLNIYKDGVSATDNLNPAENVELLLSDGWYCVKATLDKLLIKLVCDGKIAVGTKLVTHGSELLNCEQGVAPWEDTSSVRLKIFGNSTRRAHWSARLGFHGNGTILSYLTALKPEGGKISKLRVIVTRVYPMLYVEKFDDGSTVTRSERLENLHQMKYEMERETMLEKIYEEVEKEFCTQISQCDSVDSDKKSLESGSQIYQLMKKNRDPAEFRACLTHSQAKLLQEYIDKRREISLHNLQSKVRSVLKERGLNVTRNVIAMLKIRVADVYKENVTKAMITVWRPHESLLHLLGREGTWLDIHNVVPTATRYSELQISAGKQSLFCKTSKVSDKMLNIARTFERKCYLIQELTQNPCITTDYNEVDLVGFVFDIEPSFQEFDSKKQLFQNVFLADANKKIICINFWGGLKKFGFENILETEQVVACINLQKRSGNTRKNIPQYRATEFTYFTKTPKIDVCRQVYKDLSKQFLTLDKRKFIQDCIKLRNNLANMKYGNTENISPYRFNNSDYNLSKNKIFINSPNGDPNFNINGLDFESSFKQSDAVLSPKALLRKKEIGERIAKLQKYGEPPPLSSIHMANKSRNAVKPFRSPLISKHENSNQSKGDVLIAVKPHTDDSSALNDLGDVKSNTDRCTSPVLPFKKTVNPVKLNFSKQNVSKNDPFSEDFETSPPLSLD